MIIQPEGGGTYERNIAAQLLTGLTWTETEIEAESIEGEEAELTGYRYTANLPTSGTYAAMRDGLMRSDIEGMTLEGYKLQYETTEQIDPATAFVGKYVDYQIATPVTGTHSINPAGKLPNDMGTEEVIGGGAATGTIVISYMRGFKDSVRAMMTEFKEVKADLEEQGYTKPLYCVGAWLKNANTASPTDQDNPDALAVFGNKEWALDWRPFLVDMTAVEGERKKRPVMELRKNNWLRDIYGNWAPVVGITTAMRDECMANILYTDNEGQNQYCAAGAFDPEVFLALCQTEVVDGVKKLTHPTLYKAVTENEETSYVEVTHYLMPWETTETKYLCSYARFSSGITAVDACGNESQWIERGGVRIKASGDSEWTYKNWDGSGKIYYKDGSVYKIVAGSFAAYSDTSRTEETFTVECCLRTGLMLGCDISGDIGPYWGGGCEIVGECKTAPSSGSYGYTLKAYIEPDQEKWVNEGNTSVNIGTKFPSGFEDKYRYAGSIVTRANSYIRRRLPNTPLPVTQGASFGKGECGYGYMANYWGSAGKKTRVGVRSGCSASNGNLSARYLNANNSVAHTNAYYCASAKVEQRNNAPVSRAQKRQTYKTSRRAERWRSVASSG